MNGELAEKLLDAAVMGLVVVICLPIHELAHGWVAHRLGDPTAENAGRLTLNPFAHLDLFGTLALFIFHFGWAKPVPVNPSYFKKPKRDMALVALAGPVANLLMAFVFMLAFKCFLGLAAMDTRPQAVVAQILYTILWTNLSLAVFNFLPVPPLDGSRILAFFLPDRIGWQMQRLQKFFYIALIALLYFGIIGVAIGVVNGWLFTALDFITRPLDWLLAALLS